MEARATLLYWLRRPQDERQLTDCMGEAARCDSGFARGLAESLLKTMVERGSLRAAELLERLPAELTCRPQDPMTGKALERWRPRRRERPPERGWLDWVLQEVGDHPRWHLGVEVEIEAGLAQNQLRTYHEGLSKKTGKKGLMVLAKNWPAGGLLSETEDRYWLGVALWEYAFPHLRTIKATDSALKGSDHKSAKSNAKR